MEPDSTPSELSGQDTRTPSSREVFLERLIAHVPAAIAFLDASLVMCWANAEYARLYHVELRDILYKHLYEIYPEAEVQMGPMLDRAVEAGGELTERNFPFYYAVNGVPHMSYWDISFCPIYGPGKRLEGFLLMSIEVSERVENERRHRQQIDSLRKADRVKDELMSLVSHELRTPIHAMMGFGRILEKGRAGPLNPEQQKFLTKMLEVAENLARIVNDILDMSQLQSGTLTIAPRKLSLTEAAQGAIAELAPLAEQKQLTVRCELNGDLPPVYADEFRIKQVLINLVTNAIKFSPAGGQIWIKAKANDGVVRCEVVDTGEGIHPRDTPRLFQPFSQVDMSASRSQKGTGLGLSISRGIVEAHGGIIGVDSVPGQGSTFWFTLPVTRN